MRLNPKDFNGKTLQIYKVDPKKGVIGETGAGVLVEEKKK